MLIQYRIVNGRTHTTFFVIHVVSTINSYQKGSIVYMLQLFYVTTTQYNTGRVFFVFAQDILTIEFVAHSPELF